jgi:hypothetical protein
MNEAFSDYFPCSFTGDHYMGERLYRSSPSTYMRSLVNTNRMPDDWADQVHEDSKILSGALWEIRTALGAGYTDSLIHAACFGFPETFETMLTEVLVADDDDGDLSNGTPNAVVIYTAFFNHGIGPGLNLYCSHEPLPDSEDPLHGYTAYAIVTSTVSVNTDISYLSYSTNSGATWSNIALTRLPMSNRYSATIPAQSMGTTVDYYLYITNIGGQIVYDPPEGASSPHSFVVGTDTQNPVITHPQMPNQSPIGLARCASL